MATVFPFNKISTLPLTILSVLLPTFLKQKNLLNKNINSLQQKIDGLSKNVSCNDAEISSIKQDLEQLTRSIAGIQQLANLLQPIEDGLRIASTTANILLPIQLAIPSVIGVPEGPKEQLITALAELLQNITVVLNMLNTVVSNINDINTNVSNIVSAAENTISSICNNSDTTDLSNLSSQQQLNTSQQISTVDRPALPNIELNFDYPSEFYRDVNVSDDDLQIRIDQIQNLIDEQLNVLDNLIELPSKVLRGTGQPNNNLGNVGDYYIDVETQIVYGPKNTQNSWQ